GIFAKLIKIFKRLGYRDNVNLVNLGYDFRKVPDMNDMYRMMKSIVNVYYNNHNKKVVIICYSFGGIVANRLLNILKDEWKNKYIDKLITMSTPWLETIEILHTILRGESFGSPLIDRFNVRKVQISLETSIYLIPDKLDIGFEKGRLRYNAMKSVKNVTMSPGVENFCLYGTHVPTKSTIDYRTKNFPNGKPVISRSDGDRVVAHTSLSHCEQWNNKTTHIKTFPNVRHPDLLENNDVINHIMDILNLPHYIKEKFTKIIY
ncbi:hypothetical protein A3Q56_07908, partial [Intoshia linei]